MTSEPHRIRLPHPWKMSTLVGTEATGDAARVVTTQKFERTFQRPSGLTEDSRIELEVQIQPLPVPSSIDGLQRIACELNEQLLKYHAQVPGTYRFPLAPGLLQPTNTIVIHFLWLGQPPHQPLPQVALVLS